MYECFSLNAGPYIKLGQMVGQLHMLLPKEYLDTFEPMCMQAPKTPYSEIKKIVEEELGMPIHEVYDCKR
jgi:predicted unusual protein kinase regulating ubiquinone biosynthesis (AarF/ABC1/UbiB family)